MAQRNLKYTGDGGLFFLTSAGRWSGTQFGAGPALATLRNQQCRKVIYVYETTDAGTGVTTRQATKELLVLTKAEFDALNVGDPIPAAGDVKGTPLPAAVAPQVTRLAAKIQEDPLASIQKGA